MHRFPIAVVASVLASVLVCACEAPSGNELNPEAGYSSIARLAGRSTQGKSLTLTDPSCTSSGSCVCKGVVEESVRGELGRSVGQLEKGVACLASDLDGNGAVDFVIPVGEGVAVILMNGATGLQRHLTLDVGGDVALTADKKTLRTELEGMERTWAWSGEGFAYVETPKG